MKKPAGEAVDHENLTRDQGGRPVASMWQAKDGESKEPVSSCCSISSEKYDIAEEDFLSAEIEIVPAGARARWASTA